MKELLSCKDAKACLLSSFDRQDAKESTDGEKNPEESFLGELKRTGERLTESKLGIGRLYSREDVAIFLFFQFLPASRRPRRAFGTTLS